MKLKKYFATLVIFMILSLTFSVPVFAEDEFVSSDSAIVEEETLAARAAAPTITVSSKTAHTVGTQQAITIDTKDTGRLGALEFDVTYDSGALAQMSVKIAQGVHCKTNVIGNKVSYALADAAGLDLSQVCGLAFIANKSSTITLSNVKAWNVSGTAINLVVKNGEMKVDTNIPLGDANGDYTIDVMDILRIQDEILGRKSTTILTAAADINQDGVVDVRDIVAIQNVILGRK